MLTLINLVGFGATDQASGIALSYTDFKSSGGVVASPFAPTGVAIGAADAGRFIVVAGLSGHMARRMTAWL